MIIFYVIGDYTLPLPIVYDKRGCLAGEVIFSYAYYVICFRMSGWAVFLSIKLQFGVK